MTLGAPTLELDWLISLKLTTTVFLHIVLYLYFYKYILNVM